MAEHPNATAYRRTAAAFRAGDLAAIEELIEEDVVWHIPGTNRWAGDLRGREAVAAFLAGLIGTGFWLTEHDVFGNDEHVCALSVVGIHQPDLEVETRVVNVFHFRGGRQSERWFFPESLALWDQILGAPPSEQA
ncbi:MAG: nuclear transport factor 2 family protein [Chloroflexi bacterium]|nr:nuclear transport factor 2 family protein [Chloroflexota bacterium]